MSQQLAGQQVRHWDASGQPARSNPGAIAIGVEHNGFAPDVHRIDAAASTKIKPAGQRVDAQGNRIADMPPNLPPTTSGIRDAAGSSQFRSTQHAENQVAGQRENDNRPPYRQVAFAASETGSKKPGDPTPPLKSCGSDCAKAIAQGGGLDSNKEALPTPQQEANRAKDKLESDDQLSRDELTAWAEANPRWMETRPPATGGCVHGGFGIRFGQRKRPRSGWQGPKRWQRVVAIGNATVIVVRICSIWTTSTR